MMKALQKLGKAMMLPVSVLPVCGILMGLGYALAPAAMGAAGAQTGLRYTLGYFLIQAGSALIDNMAILFAIGVGLGLAEDGTAGLAGMVSYLVVTTLLRPEAVEIFAPSRIATEVDRLAFSKIGGNAFIGILAGILGGICCNRFRGTKLPDALSFFSGKRSVAIVTVVASVVLAGALLFLWPLVFGGLYAIGSAIAGLGPVGAGIYVFLNRLLIPTGLHHALNNVFWFDTVGLGDLNAYWAGLT
jgi:PTS system N-acetylglucosamine-specific IIC component